MVATIAEVPSTLVYSKLMRQHTNKTELGIRSLDSIQGISNLLRLNQVVRLIRIRIIDSLLEPAYDILLLVAYAHKLPLNVHTDVTREIRGLMFVSRILALCEQLKARACSSVCHLHPYLVYPSS